MSSDTSSSVPRPLTPHLRPAARPRRASRPAGAARPGPRPCVPTPELVVDCAVYVDGRRIEPADPHDALREATERGGFVWLGLYEPSEAELGAIAARYGLHPLAVEDAVYAHQRPKLDHYDDGIFMVLKTATYVEHEELTATSEVVETGEIMVFLGANYVITVRHGDHGALTDLRRSLEEQRDLLCLGPAAVLYGVADHVVDDFVDRRRRGRGRRRRARGVGLQLDAHRRHRPPLPAQAGADVAAQGGLAARGAAGAAGEPAGRRRPGGDALVLPRRRGPRHPRARRGQPDSTSC